MNQTILIVEDEPAIAENIKFALETEGYGVIWQSVGGQVMATLAGASVDLIVLDIGLPDLNGLDLCKQIRERHTIPVIFLTARSEEIDRVVGLEIGADDYMVKPFSPRELAARVRAVLRRTNGDLEGALPAPGAGCFRIVEDKRRIFYDGQPLDLSRYEYEILKRFIQQPGRIYSRETLMSLVWDAPEMSMDRTVDAHIKNLRKKLKAVRDDLDPIITHRSVGYSLREGL